MTTKARSDGAVKATRSASCRKRQLKEFLRHCDRKGYTAPERALMIALWVHSPNGANGTPDTSSMCWPKIGSLAALSGLTERSVTRTLATLADAGEVWIARPGRARGGLAGRLNVGTKELDRGVNVYLLTYFSPEKELREWAALVSKGIRIDGAGLEKHAAPPAEGPASAARSAAGGRP